MKPPNLWYFVGFDFLMHTQLRYFESPHYLWLVTELCHGEDFGCLPTASMASTASMALGWHWDGQQELCERIISEQRGLPETEVMGLGRHGGHGGHGWGDKISSLRAGEATVLA